MSKAKPITPAEAFKVLWIKGWASRSVEHRTAFVPPGCARPDEPLRVTQARLAPSPADLDWAHRIDYEASLAFPVAPMRYVDGRPVFTVADVLARIHRVVCIIEAAESVELDDEDEMHVGSSAGMNWTAHVGSAYVDAKEAGILEDQPAGLFIGVQASLMLRALREQVQQESKRLAAMEKKATPVKAVKRGTTDEQMEIDNEAAARLQDARTRLVLRTGSQRGAAEEVATEMGCDVATVYRRARRAKERVRTAASQKAVSRRGDEATNFDMDSIAG